MAKYITNDNGRFKEVETGASGGSVDANKIPELDAAGKLKEAMFPAGIGRDINTFVASEPLSAGAVVNIHKDGADFKVRNADASTNKPCDGFVLAAVASGSTAEVYSEGTNTAVTGLTEVDVFLSETAGQVTNTAPTQSGRIVQRLGVAATATSFNFEAGTVITLA